MGHAIHRILEEDPVAAVLSRSADQGVSAGGQRAAACRGHRQPLEEALRRGCRRCRRPRFRIARRSAGRPTCRAATRSRPAVTASSAIAGSAWSRCRAAASSSSPTKSSAARFRKNYIPAVEKGIIEAAANGLPGRLSGGRLQGHGLRRLLSRCRFVGTGVQAGGPQSVQGRDGSRPSRRCSSRS